MSNFLGVDRWHIGARFCFCFFFLGDLENGSTWCQILHHQILSLQVELTNFVCNLIEKSSRYQFSRRINISKTLQKYWGVSPISRLILYLWIWFRACIGCPRKSGSMTGTAIAPVFMWCQRQILPRATVICLQPRHQVSSIIWLHFHWSAETPTLESAPLSCPHRVPILRKPFFVRFSKPYRPSCHD